MQRKIIRRIIQVFFLVGATYLFLQQDYIHAPRPIFSWLGWLDPWTGLANIIKGNWRSVIILSFIALALAAWRGRFFCGWLCPVGTLLDLTTIIKRLVRWSDWRPSTKNRRLLNLIRWAAFGGVFGLVVVGRPGALTFNPLVLWPRDIHNVLVGTFPWTLAFLVLVGLMTFPRFWCRFLCPTGSLLHLIALVIPKKMEADSACVHCGLCEKKCSIQNIQDTRWGADCLDCGDCRRICAKKAVKRSQNKVLLSVPVDEGRRGLITAITVGAGVAVAESATRTLPVHSQRKGPLWSRLLRPPGALKEQDFNATCNRCGQCLSVCPTRVLIPTGLEAGISGVWTPRFIPRKGRCMLCMSCGQVCPTGALAPIPMESARLGTALVDHSRCLAWSKGTHCLLCVEVCPTFALSIDPKGRPIVDESKCIGCGACEAGCPVEGAAIHVTNKGERRRR